MKEEKPNQNDLYRQPKKRKKAPKLVMIDNKENHIKMICIDRMSKHDNTNNINKLKQNF